MQTTLDNLRTINEQFGPAKTMQNHLVLAGFCNHFEDSVNFYVFKEIIKYI